MNRAEVGNVYVSPGSPSPTARVRSRGKVSVVSPTQRGNQTRRYPSYLIRGWEYIQNIPKRRGRFRSDGGGGQAGRDDG